MKIEINKKEYKYRTGMALMERLGAKLGTDEMSDILESLDDLHNQIRAEKLKISTIPKLAEFISDAITAGGSKPPNENDLQEWVYSNIVTATKVYFEFLGQLPGKGNSDMELVEGNLKAAQEAA